MVVCQHLGIGLVTRGVRQREDPANKLAVQFLGRSWSGSGSEGGGGELSRRGSAANIELSPTGGASRGLG